MAFSTVTNSFNTVPEYSEATYNHYQPVVLTLGGEGDGGEKGPVVFGGGI